MIVKMSKVYVVSQLAGSDALLGALGKLGVVHLSPIDPAKAVAQEKTTTAIDKLNRAVQALQSAAPSENSPDIDPMDAADEVMHIQRDSAERQARLTRLHRQIEQMTIWGDVKLDQFAQLQEAGVKISFLAATPEQVDQIQAELVQVLGDLTPVHKLVAAINLDAEAELDETIEEIPLPDTDRPTILAEAGEIDSQLKAHKARLNELACLLEPIEKLRDEFTAQAEWTIAHRSGMSEDTLYAVVGWVPTDKAETLAEDLTEAGIDSAVQVMTPTEDEDPPTLIKYPFWARTIKGLFEILGTLPGYREIDLSPFFMIALPLFAAILIGDAGYGLVFLALPLIYYRKLVAAAGPAKIHLLIVIGAGTIIWGIGSANYFGITPETMAKAGNYTMQIKGNEVADYDAMSAGTDAWAAVGRGMATIAPLWRNDPEQGRDLMMKLSFIIGVIHLTLAQLRRAAAMLPRAAALAPLGWAIFLWGMFGIIWYLMFLDIENTNWSLIGPVLVAGYVLILGFSSQSKNPIKRVVLGFAGSLLPALSAFSDTMSYVRLMAVGLASYYIAAAFNDLGASLAETATWFVAAPIIVFGHALNIGLAVIAIFAHGVRLNMLEFSNNVGVQWSGYAFKPFAGTQSKES